MRNDNPNFLDKEELDNMIGGVLEEMDQAKRADMWRAILTAVHKQAV